MEKRVEKHEGRLAHLEEKSLDYLLKKLIRMPCVLWISCDCSSEDLIKTLLIKPYKAIEKGSTVATKEGDKYYEHTLCGFDVSNQDFLDLKILIQETIAWLEENFENLSKLNTLNATAKLDFGYYSKFADSKIVAQYDTIPYPLLKLAGDLKIDIELSQYWYAEDQGAQLN